jgi:hypothetical protein
VELKGKRAFRQCGNFDAENSTDGHRGLMIPAKDGLPRRGSVDTTQKGAPGMADLAQWLAGLPLSQAMRRIAWLFPLLQTIHILATGMMLSSVIMISLRLWGVSRTQTMAARGHRYMPWIWTSLVVLIVTGVALVVGNPRTLRDPALQVKLWMMVPAVAASLILAVGMRGDGMWEKNRSVRGMMSLAATAAFVLWLGVTLAGRGRWIVNLIG